VKTQGKEKKEPPVNTVIQTVPHAHPRGKPKQDGILSLLDSMGLLLLLGILLDDLVDSGSDVVDVVRVEASLMGGNEFRI